MKKTIIAIMMFAGICLAQGTGKNSTTVYDTVVSGDTNTTYIGIAEIAPNYVPAETNNEWRIIRVVTVSNLTVSVKTAAGIGTGDAYWYTAKWSDRASTNTVYK